MGNKFSFLFLLHLIGSAASSGYLLWNPPDVDYPNLLCSTHCFSESTTHLKNRCCYCNNVKAWEIGQEKINNLQVEYRNIKGSDAVFIPERNYNAILPSNVKHIFGILSSLPVNMCLFPNIVSLVLSNNVIKEIRNVSCLFEVEIMDFRANKIRSISNTSFSSLKKLRKLDLSFNEISHIDSNSFQGNTRSIFHVTLSHSKIKEIDVSNLLFQKGYCEVNYDENPIIKLSNPSRFKVDMNKSYGNGGTQSLQNINLTQYVNFTDVGLSDITEFYKVFDFHIDTTNTDIRCDCLLYPILESQIEIVQRIWTPFWENGDLKCGSPQGLKNVLVRNIIKFRSMREKMTCERKEHCPHNCRCFEQPINRHLVVNCSKAGLNDFPRSLPWFSNMTLLMDGNNFKSLPDVDFLERVHSLDISNCKLTNIDSKAVKRLPKNVKINISGNLLDTIPNDLIIKGASLGILRLHCNCDIISILNWNTYQNRNNNTVVYCQNYDGKTLQQAESRIREVCKEDKENVGIIAAITLAFICIIIICVCAILYICYGLELLILYRIYLRRKIIYRDAKYENDIYICMDDSNADIRGWVLQSLVPAIEKLEMTIFLPCRDADVGQSIGEDLYLQIDNSRSFIIILNEALENINEEKFESVILAMELNRIWHNFKTNPMKNIIAINFDDLKSTNVKNRFAKAILRTHVDINVTNRYQKVLHRVIENVKHHTFYGLPLTKRKAWS